MGCGSSSPAAGESLPAAARPSGNTAKPAAAAPAAAPKAAAQNARESSVVTVALAVDGGDVAVTVTPKKSAAPAAPEATPAPEAAPAPEAPAEDAAPAAPGARSSTVVNVDLAVDGDAVAVSLTPKK